MGWKLCIVAARLLGLAMVVPSLTLTCSAADPIVSNVTVAQRPGTKLVDIGYDLVADGEVDISVTISGDGGATWTVPASSLAGDVGIGVAAGTGKAVVWDGGADWNGQHSVQSRVRVTANPVQDEPMPYLVIDLAAGSAAASYPVSYLAAVPEGGWTQEYKTTKLVLRRVLAGTFVMGSPEGELGRHNDEKRHPVTLTKDSHIGVFEVTQKQWERVMGNWPSYFSNESVRDARPVEQVFWDDIRGGDWPGDPAGSGLPAPNSFVQRLRERTGVDFDLPTEARWEHACRAGTSTSLNSGKNLTDITNCPNLAEVGRYRYNGGSGYTQGGDLSVGTAAVGSYLPNAWGLYDFHGNAYEFCLDWYWDEYPDAVTDPPGPSTGPGRIVRGGCYGNSHALMHRSAERTYYLAGFPGSIFGFRMWAPAPSHTLTFDLGAHGARTGGGALTQQVPDGGAATAPTFTVAAGWSFLGWDAEFAEVTSDLNVTAQYEPMPYLVIDLAVGSAAASYPVSYLEAVPAGGWTAEHKTTKLVLRRIPAGTFTMGSPAGELGRWGEETQHEVSLTKDLCVGVFEVTQKQWERVMGTWPSYFNNATYRDTRPIDWVSYNDVRGSTSGAAWPASNSVDATSFMGILRQKTGLATLDLPTESQWEYACRAGTTTALNSGKNLTDDSTCPNLAEAGRYKHDGGYPSTQGGDLSAGTAAVGSYLPNAWGLYDMHGNVYEWCLDWDGAYPGTVTDPGGAAGGSSRVLRGGSWRNSSARCRSAYRWSSPSSLYYSLGFRLVRAVP